MLPGQGILPSHRNMPFGYGIAKKYPLSHSLFFPLSLRKMPGII